MSNFDANRESFLSKTKRFINESKVKRSRDQVFEPMTNQEEDKENKPILAKSSFKKLDSGMQDLIEHIEATNKKYKKADEELKKKSKNLERKNAKLKEFSEMEKQLQLTKIKRLKLMIEKERKRAEESHSLLQRSIQQRDEVVVKVEDQRKKNIQKKAEYERKFHTEFSTLQAEVQSLKNKREKVRHKYELNQEAIKEIESDVREYKTNINQMKTEMAVMQENDFQLSLYQKLLRNKIHELKGNIRVFCRIRPVLESDDPDDIVCKLGVNQVMKIRNFHNLEVNTSSFIGKEISQKVSRNSIARQTFEFDAIFGAESTQEEFFKEIHHLVLSALDGYKVCIFAYGQTGSGKTHTMEGDIESEEDRGIIPRAIEALFENITKMEELGWEFKIKVSFQEIYLDEVRDLLLTGNSMKQINKAMKYEPTIVEVDKIETVLYLLNTAKHNRSVAETSANARSSRSHSIFQLLVESRTDSVIGGKELNGAINLIDLAGSERIHKIANAKNNKERKKESTEINKSLTSLRDVITSLKNRDKFVPYRNSKLTYLLQPHLSAKSAKTLMIVNASPLACHASETINSLKFASQVNSCIMKDGKLTPSFKK
ncbi:unnamed protein product [Moneuplotes crassus]|uniref:Kinesin motor domain-containing protein n=1 Tax=Euplotes crassus TaxID=5936 RepID=A0AAD1U696_EUPCR|nr:unnamed protein product [Moneuplotes crassus]